MAASMPAPRGPDEDDESTPRVARVAAVPAPRPPRKKRPPRPRAVPPPVAADPGPPPPLPVDVDSQAAEFQVDLQVVEEAPPRELDVVVPPIPPPPVAASVVAEAAAAASPIAPLEAPLEAPRESELDAESDSDAVIELAPAPELQPEPAPEAEPDLASEPDVEPEAEPDLASEPDIEQPSPVDHDAIEALAVVLDSELVSAPDTDMAVPALSLRGVTKSFGETHAVDGIDLTVPAGTFYGIVGPNGAGKTTTLSMIAGLLRPDKGRISVNGVDAASDPISAKRGMGVLPDRLRTFDRLTGRQLLYYYGILRGLKPAIVESRTADLARAFDLTGALSRVVSDYSTGMTKKVMLAGAMIHSPRLLVLDEPFESVDPVSSAIILDILATYVAHGGTVVLSSHGMDLVERVCTRVAVIVAGQVLAEGTIDEVRGELTLEQRFIELAGGLSDVEGLEWLHTFSD